MWDGLWQVPPCSYISGEVLPLCVPVCDFWITPWKSGDHIYPFDHQWWAQGLRIIFSIWPFSRCIGWQQSEEATLEKDLEESLLSRTHREGGGG